MSPGGGHGTLTKLHSRSNCSLNALVVVSEDPTVPVSVAIAVNNPKILLMRRFMSNVM